MKFKRLLDKAFCDQYLRHVGIDLNLKNDTIVYNKRRVRFTSELKESLRVDMIDAIRDSLKTNHGPNN